MKWSNKGRVDYSQVITAILITMLVITWFIWIFALLMSMSAPAQVTAGDITNFRTATRQAPATLHLDYATTRESVPVVTILCEVSAYNATVVQTDGNPLITASGQKVRVGGVAADLRVLPFGSIVIIPNYNNGKPCTVTDTGSAIRGNKLDVFMWRESEAIHWGRRRNVKVQVLYVPKVKS